MVELTGKGNYTGKASVSVIFTISAKKGTPFTVGSCKKAVCLQEAVGRERNGKRSESYEIDIESPIAIDIKMI